MELSNQQKKILHAAARQAGLTDEQRRVVQFNIGGFYSAADPTVTREGMIAVMAFYEDRCSGQVHGFTRGYWRSEDAKANPTDGLLHRCGLLADRLFARREDLDRFIAGDHFTGGQYQHLDELPAFWLRKLLEALKAIARRKGVA
jgi:hypothetical protein